MITAKLMCGLGNMMFQIAAATSLAINNNDIAYFDLYSHRKCGQGFEAIKYKNNILKNINEGRIIVKNIYNEPNFSYGAITYSDGLEICGCFQSEKYFIKNKNEILKLFSINDNISYKLTNFLLKTNPEIKNTVSLHVRRGDYLNHPNSHRFIGVDYIYNSLSKFENSMIYVFSDDIEWCKNNIKECTGNHILFVNRSFGFEDYEEIYLMSMCDNNIISNSSFSGWGSYLNNNKNKIVIAPDKWFCDNYVDNYNDIYYEGVIRL